MIKFKNWQGFTFFYIIPITFAKLCVLIKTLKGLSVTGPTIWQWLQNKLPCFMKIARDKNYYLNKQTNKQTALKRIVLRNNRKRCLSSNILCSYNILFGFHSWKDLFDSFNLWSFPAIEYFAIKLFSNWRNTFDAEKKIMSENICQSNYLSFFAWALMIKGKHIRFRIYIFQTDNWFTQKSILKYKNMGI